MKRYNPKELEPKWQEEWNKAGIYKAIDFDPKQKFVMLCEFPYPSGAGMHIGHIKEYTIGDIIARQKRMMGYNVLFPMGYDAFGLPTENYAIKNKISPIKATEDNVANFRVQLESMGFSIDWTRSFKTSDPDYYKWTQWLFLQFFNNGLAYQEKIAVNWCPFCKTGLANEEVVNGRHERCDTLVEKKLLKQWLLRITDYAERLIAGLKDVDYPSRIADQQINWIGKSKGAQINFKIESSDQFIEVFTTRPDTIFGATFLVIAPDHPLVEELTKPDHKKQVNELIEQVSRQTDIERQENKIDKHGVFSGSYAINPANKEKIPIWIADYVLMGYGTGAIMAVPAHDERDNAFARKYDLPIKYVIEPVSGEEKQDEIKKEAVVVVLRNPKTNQYLILNWGPRKERYGGRLLIGGSIEPKESLEDCAKREIAEETGFTNVKMVSVLDYRVHSHYFSNVVNKDFHAEISGMMFDLIDETRQEIQLDEGEKDKFKLEWVEESSAVKLIDDKAHLHIFEALIKNSIFSGEGIMTGSGHYNGISSSLMRDKIVSDLEAQGSAKEKINYRLRDWIFSRQHYWGEPIPIIHCPKHGAVAVPIADLPVELPKVDHYEPTDNGESPLAAIDEWVNVACPVCGGPAHRETDTMPNWAGSSWYYLRYFDAHNDKAFADRSKLDYWGSVDLYLGGMEHTTLHLLYSRFWHQFLYDQGLVPTAEPYAARRGQGIILGPDGSKMSKSKGNIVNPTEIISSGYGADSLRLAIAFLAPYDQTSPWSPESLGGTSRFLNRLWTLVHEFNSHDGGLIESIELKQVINKTIFKVSKDIEQLGFNTAIASLMECMNEVYLIKAKDNYRSVEWQWAIETLLKLIAPFAPHITEELWHEMGNDDSIHQSEWPKSDNQYLQIDNVVVVVQVNGKLRGDIKLAKDKASQDDVMAAILKDEKISKYIINQKIDRIIFVEGKLINLVIK